MRGAGSSQVSWVKDSFESSGILSARSRLFHYIKISTRKTPETQRFRGFWRRSRDLNPGCDYSHYSLSRGAPSATWVLPQMCRLCGRAELCQLVGRVEHDVVSVLQQFLELVGPVGGAEHMVLLLRQLLPAQAALVQAAGLGACQIGGQHRVEVVVGKGLLGQQNLGRAEQLCGDPYRNGGNSVQ